MISVVIPTCDRPALLDEAVKCVLTQTLQPYEVLIVNNGSSPLLDVSAAVKCVNIMPYAGAAQARNFGVLMAQGDYIAFLDDDDLWEESYLEKVQQLIMRHEPDMIITRLDRMVDGVTVPYRDVSRLTDLYSAVLTTNPGVGGPNTIVKRETFMAVGGYDVQLITSEDRALLIEFYRHDCRIITAGDIQSIARDPGTARLTERSKMIEGKRRFLWKYHKLMPPAIRFHNLAILNYQRFRLTHYPWYLLFTAWFLALAYLWRRRS